MRVRRLEEVEQTEQETVLLCVFDGRLANRTKMEAIERNIHMFCLQTALKRGNEIIYGKRSMETI